MGISLWLCCSSKELSGEPRSARTNTTQPCDCGGDRVGTRSDLSCVKATWLQHVPASTTGLKQGCLKHAYRCIHVSKIEANFKRTGPNGRAVFNRSNTGIVGSNPARGMDMCPCFSELCSPV